ncbi:tRNA-modifying protein YgfZ [Pasteurellaceae bacterium HPA106]|uniref:tRNA-modifying protein YgfZ n=1 Tax=Spirabiliibacterium pneumoniae TaxID=221400 RepID=UPI001AAD5B05|nr:tRNA-modifying protein YgfZ [Spirabiliibacterium pneumoniae]MBE2897080.1 tRNA-modifying protein YgfZ [Spirabiliibacterium pneumoniae]
MTALCSRNQLSGQHTLLTCPLNQFQLIDIKGDDAQKFLQGQLTCDVNKLAPGENTLCAHCDPKGKVWAVYWLVKFNEQHFALIVRKALQPKALQELKKYAVFSKVTFNEREAALFGLAGSDAAQALSAYLDAPNSEIPMTQHGELVCCFLACPQPRFLLIAPLGSVDIAFTHDETLWDVLDQQDGIPVLSSVSQNEFIPQALNLQHLGRAISFQKGCYIGQETVARAKYRGANKRALFTLTTQSPLQVELGGSVELALEQNWRKTGHIISHVTYDSTSYMQVVLAKDTQPTSKMRLGDVPLSLLALPFELNDE